MRNALAPHQTTPRETAEFAAGALFVDLDETLLQGTINGLEMKEIALLRLNPAVLAKIEQATACGVPVVMVTRNNDDWIERFFQAHPKVRALFTDCLACPTGRKSDKINQWLRAHDIPPELAAFADDTAAERQDVEANVPGGVAVSPEQIGRLKVERVDTSRRYLVQTLLN